MPPHAANHSADSAGPVTDSVADSTDPATAGTDTAGDRTGTPIDRTSRSLTTEFALAVAVLVGFHLWQRAVPTAPSPMYDAVPLSGNLLVDGLVRTGVLLAGFCLLAGAYATLRDIEVGTELPAVDDLSLAGLALLMPAALVGLTKAVGALTGVPYGSLTLTAFAADAPIEPFLVVTGLGLFLGVPSSLLTCQIVVQGSFENAVDGDVAVVLTTVVAGFLLTGSPGNLSPFPEWGTLVGAALFVAAVGVALHGPERVDSQWLRPLAYAPVLLLAAVAVLGGVAAIETVAGGLFVTTQLVVLGFAAYAYERTETLVVPGLAYLSLSLTSSVVVFAFEAGMRSW